MNQTPETTNTAPDELLDGLLAHVAAEDAKKANAAAGDKTFLFPADAKSLNEIAPAFSDRAETLGYVGLHLTHQENNLMHDLLRAVSEGVPAVTSGYDEDAGVYVSETDEPDTHKTCLVLIAGNSARRLMDDLRPVHTPSIFDRDPLTADQAIDLIERGAPSVSVRLADRSTAYALRADVAFMLAQMHLLAYPIGLEASVIRSLRDMHSCEGGPRLTEEEARAELAERLEGVLFQTVMRTLVEKLVDLDRDRYRHAPKVKRG